MEVSPYHRETLRLSRSPAIFMTLLFLAVMIVPVAAAPSAAADCSCGAVGLPLDNSYPVGSPGTSYYALTCQYGGYADIPYAGKGTGVEFEIEQLKPDVARLEFLGRANALPSSNPGSSDVLEYDRGDQNRAVYSSKMQEGEKTRYSGTHVLVYKNTNYIFVYGLGYDSGDGRFLSVLNAAETCAKAVADAKQQTPPSPSASPQTGGSSPAVRSGGGTAQSTPLQVNWNQVPAAAAQSVIPAGFGAVGGLIGGMIGALFIIPPGGFPETGELGGEGGEGPGSGEVPERGTEPPPEGESIPVEQVTGTQATTSQFPPIGTVEAVDPKYHDRVKEWLKNQVYQAGSWYVTADGRFIASDFMLPDNPTPEHTKIPIDEILSDDRFSSRVPSDLHQKMAAQAAAQIPLDDLEKLRRGRWQNLPESEREALLRRLAPVFGAPIKATDARVDVWRPGFVRPEGGPTDPIPANYPAQQYKIRHGPGDYESHIELNSTSPQWTEGRALNAVITLGHELKHIQQASVNDMEGYSPDDIRTRNFLVKQSYDSNFIPSHDPSRYAANYTERDAESYGKKLAAAISRRLRDPGTRDALKTLDELRKTGTVVH